MLNSVRLPLSSSRREELKGVEELYAKFGDHLPKELADELATVKANLEK